jgi:H+-translocating NAD(P) transhydrogenase subunit beta
MAKFMEISYIIATILFFMGLKYLGSPATARRGNAIAALGMAIAIGGTLFDSRIVDWRLIAISLAIGSIIGTIGAYKVAMTQMPQMVGLLNGLGGGASMLIALAQVRSSIQDNTIVPLDSQIATIAGIFIGGITLTGSLIAFAKLQEILQGQPIILPYQSTLNIVLFGGFVAGGIYTVGMPHDIAGWLALSAIACIMGVLFVLPIGGADMPVVISLLNSFSGMAASAVGFIDRNDILIVAGALVGASGIILTHIMCKGMNRSLADVLFGTLMPTKAKGGNATAVDTNRSSRTTDAETAAMMLGYARSVAIVPGYGMAVAQAQHALHELGERLRSKGVEVKYAIHPVAGRMPGHMNVLLAEANVPYTQLYEMDDINPEFPQIDVALVVGANDVVNPAAGTDPNSPIYGMPILEVERAKNVIAIKRGVSKGFAGIENELFYRDNTWMLFGSAKETVAEIVNAVKGL